ncbi:hypothetical protein PG990_002382 [Apiospora arundinis]|uniref:Uncharacterized protein n=1 Tax=Apiospora arundinis TaxID=335852 RepID=A0ABR2I4Q4_9PEZI
MLSSEVIVALALGIPSFFVAFASLWITYLTYKKQSPAVPANCNPFWPVQQNPLLYPNGGRGP